MLDGIAERVVAGEHDAIGAEHLQGAQQRRHGGVAADGDVHMCADDVGHRTGVGVGLAQHGVRPHQGERQVLAHVADDDL